MPTKQEIRKQLKLTHQQWSDAGTLPKLAHDIIQQLERHPLFQSAQRVLLYHSLPDEVPTHDLIRRYASRKTIILPTVVGTHLQLHIHRPDSPTHEGPFHITESDGPILTDLTTIDLAIIPARAYDPAGNRLGRGRGYYDRLLPHLHCPLIGICYPYQLLPTLPTAPHDIPVHEVITAQPQ